MTLTFSTFSLEISRGCIFARLGVREVYLTREVGQPRKFFAWQHEGGSTEFWGLGFYGVVSVGLPASRAALLEG